MRGVCMLACTVHCRCEDVEHRERRNTNKEYNRNQNGQIMVIITLINLLSDHGQVRKRTIISPTLFHCTVGVQL